MSTATGHVTQYLDAFDAQHARLFAMLSEVPEQRLWERPAPKKWCIGEHIDHTRVLNRFLRRLLWAATPVLSPIARMRGNRAFEPDIDNPFQKPGFPSQVGWLWWPRHTPKSPVTLERLRDETAAEHARLRTWFEARDEALLGHINIYDPVVGWINGIQTLRIGVHHDAHHFRAIARMVERDWDAAP